MAVSEDALSVVAGQVIATDVSLDEYMEKYAAEFCEWVEGMVIKMPPVHGRHDELTYYLRQFFEAYFEFRPTGRVRSHPFVMRLPVFENRRREPDLQVILNSNPHELKDTYMDGPADICIEVVSPESTGRDHGEKFGEYEAGGVGEYWIIDPLREECRFYRLGEEGRYRRQNEDADGYFRTKTLPGLALHVPTLWKDELPGPAATARTLREMLERED